MDLRDVPIRDLRAEINRREEKERERGWALLNERYGPCECGAPFTSGEGKVVQEHRSAPNWLAWPLPPPPGYGQLDGVDWETTFYCENGHPTVRRETKFYEKPIKGGEPRVSHLAGLRRVRPGRGRANRDDRRRVHQASSGA